ncbi:MAG: DUF3747 domain-containing protein [Aphanocapsa sp. GSE-SYN-MK-11-07L]|jgi:hypothetical protein|nr:DUF3747 domain-containing protein [Aphanocapsa sp. GSE-SYN-MK-11-07L]
MSHSLQFYSAALLTGLAAVAWLPQPARAEQVSQKEIDQSSVVAIAIPYNNRQQYRLMLLEQLTSSKRCWRESGTAPVSIDPVLPNYDRAEMCRRSADLSDFSLRVAGQDLAARYDLKLIKQDNEIVLVGSPKADGQSSSGQIFTVGRSKGLNSGARFSKIFLNPGWRMVKRTVRGSVVGHTYFTTNTVYAAASPTPTASPITSPLPQPVATTSPPTVAPPRSAISISVPPPATLTMNRGYEIKIKNRTDSAPTSAMGSGPDVTPIKLRVPLPEKGVAGTLMPVAATDPTPTLDIPSSADSSGALPVPGSTIPMGNPGNESDLIARVEQLPPPPFDTSSSADLNSSPVIPSRFRVLVEAMDESQKSQIKAIAPGAFRSFYQGRSMLQVGSFTEKFKAEEMMQIMTQNGFAPVMEQTP